MDQYLHGEREEPDHHYYYRKQKPEKTVVSDSGLDRSINIRSICISQQHVMISHLVYFAPLVWRVPFLRAFPPEHIEVRDPVAYLLGSAEDDDDHVIVCSHERLRVVDSIERTLSCLFSTLAVVVVAG